RARGLERRCLACVICLARIAQFQELLKPGAALGEVAARRPEAREPTSQAQTLCDLLGCDRLAHGCAQVVVFVLEPRKPASLLWTPQVCFRLVDEGQIVCDMCALNRRCLLVSARLLPCILPDGLQHGKACSSSARQLCLRALDQVMVEEEGAR